MNNILSLVKNIFYKIKEPKKVLYVIACIASLCMIICAVFVLKDAKTIFRAMLVLAGIVIPLVPFAVKFLGAFFEANFSILDQNPKLRASIFITSAFILAVLAILAGLTIPSIY